MSDCVCDPVTRYDYHYNEWIGSYLHDCVYTPSEQVSVLFGILNILLWIPALLPQILTNYRLQRVDSLSLPFLVQWLRGDLSNLLGCLLTQALPTQCYTAIWFCCNDVMMCSQIVYYRSRHRHRPSSHSRARSNTPVINGHGSGSGSAPVSKAMRSVMVASLSIVTLLCVAHYHAYGAGSPIFQSSSSRSLLVANRRHDDSDGDIDGDLPLCNFAVPLSHTSSSLGLLCSWVSGLLYFSSALPQVIHNYRRHSTHGLSREMFVLSISANLCYAIAILLRVPVIDRRFVTSVLPFLIGSFGTIPFHAAILAQTFLYRHSDEKRDEYQEIEQR